MYNKNSKINAKKKLQKKQFKRKKKQKIRYFQTKIF